MFKWCRYQNQFRWNQRKLLHYTYSRHAFIYVCVLQ